MRQIAIFAWVPLLTAWFGLGELSKWAFVALAAFFPLFIATQRSVATLSPLLREAAQVMRLSLWQRVRVLVLPGAAPGIFAGLRLSLIYAWLGTIGAEYFMPSNGGIGSLMIGAQQLLRMDTIFSGMLLVGLTGAAYATARAVVANPLNATVLIAFLIAMFWHAKLGLQVIIEDYLHAPLLAGIAHLANIFVCALAAIAGVLAVVRIALGA